MYRYITEGEKYIHVCNKKDGRIHQMLMEATFEGGIVGEFGAFCNFSLFYKLLL